MKIGSALSLTMLIGIGLVHTSVAGGAPPQPNIILVMPDDAGYDDYACLGNPIMRTPSVDAFTLPRMLKAVGYTTGIFGKWHLGDEEAYRPESRGFDEVYIHGSGGIGQSGDAPGNTNIDPVLWADRTLVQHVGRWAKGKSAESKYAKCSIRNSRFTLVNNEELYDLKADPGEQTNVFAQYPEVVGRLRASYDQWWNDVQALLINEVATGFNHHSFRELYTKQFGAEATTEAMKSKRSKKAESGAPDADSRKELLKRRAERKERKEGAFASGKE